VYEAGYCGFWIDARFQKLGADCMVTNPADVPTSDKERRHKNDKVDASKLVREYQKGSLRPVYVPDRVAQEDRSLVRMRARFVRKETRCKNQIKALLAFYGYTQHPDEEAPGGLERYWSRVYIRWLESRMLEHESGRAPFQALVKELLELRAFELLAKRRIEHGGQCRRSKAEAAGGQADCLFAPLDVHRLSALVNLHPRYMSMGVYQNADQNRTATRSAIPNST